MRRRWVTNAVVEGAGDGQGVGLFAREAKRVARAAGPGFDWRAAQPCEQPWKDVAVFTARSPPGSAAVGGARVAERIYSPSSSD